jgi:glyoxylase-like metal-dependent hydrolase (beta-lactamase superfamily II)
VHRWQVGEVEIVRIEDEDFALPSDVPVPGWAVDAGMAPGTDETFLAFTAYGIRSGDRRILVDPWIANDWPRTQPDAAARSERLLAELTTAGFPPEDVDAVVMTHVDGLGWLTRPDGGGGWRATFPNARHLIHPAEQAAVDRGEPLFNGVSLEPLRTLLEPSEPPLVLTDEVRLEALPGHNIGHVGIRIDSGGECAALPGHLFLTVFAVADPVVSAGDGPEAETTRRTLLEALADRDGLLLLPLVGGPSGGAGRVERDGQGYRLVPV